MRTCEFWSPMWTGRRLVSLTTLRQRHFPDYHASNTASAASVLPSSPADGDATGAGGEPAEAHLAVRSLDPSLPRAPLCNDLLRSSEPSHRSEAFALLREMLRPDSSSRPDPATCSTVFSILSKRSQPIDGEALELVFEMVKQGFSPSDQFQFTQFVNKLCYGGGTGKAWDFVHAVWGGGGTVEAPVCNALLAGLARERDFQRMNKLFSEMKEMGVRPNVVTYGILINHLCKSRRVDEALQVLDVMTRPESEVSPDTVTFNTLIDGLCKVGRIEEGRGLLDRIRNNYHCDPNTVTFNSLIDGFCKVGEMDMAHELLTKMEQEGIPPNVVTLNTLVSGMCRHGRVGGALDFFRQKQRTWVDVKGNAVTYSTLVGAFLHSNNVDKAMNLFDEMVREGHRPDSVTYFTLISGLTQMGRLEKACSVASSMRKNGLHLDVKSYNILISGFCKRNMLNRAREILQEMEEAGLRPDVFTYNTLIAASCKAGDFSTVNQLLDQMVEDGCQPSVVTYGTLIHGYCKAGDLDEAMNIFRNMASPPNTVIYNSLIDSFCKNNKTEIAISLWDEMQEKGVPPTVTTYNAMFKGLQDRNMSDEAFELMDQMRKEGCQPNYVTMDILTQWLSAIGEMERLRSFMRGKVSIPET